MFYLTAGPAPECTTDSECGAAEACVNLRCVSACAGACGSGALCTAVDHRAACRCPPGTAGDPARLCYTREYLSNFQITKKKLVYLNHDIFICYIISQLNAPRMTTVRLTRLALKDTVRTHARSAHHAAEMQSVRWSLTSPPAAAHLARKVTRVVPVFQPYATTTKIAMTHKLVTDSTASASPHALMTLVHPGPSALQETIGLSALADPVYPAIRISRDAESKSQLNASLTLIVALH